MGGMGRVDRGEEEREGREEMGKREKKIGE